MAVADIATLIEAVAVRVNAGEYVMPVEAVKRYISRKKLTDVSALSVMVYPVSDEVTTGTRTSAQHVFTVAVQVNRQIGDTEKNDETERLLLLVQQIIDWLTWIVPTATNKRRWKPDGFGETPAMPTNPVAYDLTELEVNRFASLILVTFHKFR